MSSSRFCLAVLLAGLLVQPLLSPALLRAEEKVANRARLIQRAYQVADLMDSLNPAVEGGPVQRRPVALEKSLVNLITHLIAPETWREKGGPGTVDYFPLGMTLVINQTPEVHKQINALLKTLRVKQETEVVCEVRLVSLDADFGQRVFQEFGLPTKGGTHVTFFSDEQMLKFFAAAQADLGTSIMQAPKMTLRNGQEATLRVTNQQFFVTHVDVRWDGEQVRSLPINTPMETGVVISQQPLVAADGHSVKLHFQANVTSLESQKVGLSPVMTQIEPVPESGEKVEPVTFTQFIQTPKVVTIAADKVLAIPKGQTAVLSGWTNKHEVTKKWALPLLSELPGLGCLYRSEWQEPVWERAVFLVTPKVIDGEHLHSGIE
jgi:type II secretory pathway component GspD/PulD (secretin)